MKRPHMYTTLTTQKWRINLFLITIVFLVLLFSLILNHNKSPTTQISSSSFSQSNHLTLITPPSSTLPKLPRFAYLISATNGQVPQVKRLIQALYHPRNYYVIYLDVDASEQERVEIAKFAKSKSAIRRFRNVMVVGKPDLITPKGHTATAAVLHAVAILLKQESDWDCFVNLNAWDYPLFSQDDFLHIFSYVPGDLNFLEHTSDIGWKEHQRARPIILILACIM